MQEEERFSAAQSYAKELPNPQVYLTCKEGEICNNTHIESIAATTHILLSLVQKVSYQCSLCKCATVQNSTLGTSMVWQTHQTDS